jgi:membrane associated rhomboid family serine protease
MIEFPSFWAGISPEEIVQKYGMIPRDIMNGERLYTLFTSMFLHGGITHIAGNMVYLSIFGDNIEDALGRARYLFFYFLCGIAASLTHMLTTADLSVPTIGASGAISGILGAYLILYPRARILTLVFYYWIHLIRIPAIFFLGFWFILQFISGWLTLAFEITSGVAYWAHIGGFAVGMALAPLLRRRKPRRSEE